MALQTINDRIASVRLKLGSRIDQDTNIKRWLRDAYIELAMAIKFEELVKTANTVSTSGGVEGTDDIYSYPTDCRAINSIHVVRTDGSKYRLWRKNIRYLDRYSSTAGPPSIYAPWADGSATDPIRQIIVRPVPNQVITFRWRYWMLPTIDTTLENTKLRVPLDWLEIIDYSAALRGLSDLHEPERAATLHNLLHGAEDPKTGRRRPGLLAMRMTSMEAEVEDQEYPIRPRVSRFTQ